jgi:hypothetical protein
LNKILLFLRNEMSTIYFASDFVDGEKINNIRKETQNQSEDPLIEFYGKIKPKEIKRGDFMQLSKNEYRNDTMLVYDGDEFIVLSYEPDDYGTLPKEFVVGDEFAPMHFRDTNAHNTFVPFNNTRHKQKILDNLVDHDTHWTSCFKIGDFDMKMFYYWNNWEDEEAERPEFELPDKITYYNHGNEGEEFFSETKGKINYKELERLQDEGYLFLEIK